MKNALKGIMSIMILIPMFFGCDTTSEEPVEVNERIQGTWTISSMNMFGVDIPGDGSTLTFNGCDATCTGQDYEATGETTGTFTYEFIENNTQLKITDNDPDNGGSYNGTWDILDFTSSKLRLTIDTGLLGNIQMEMNK